MKLCFEKDHIRDYEEQGEKPDPVQVHHGMTEEALIRSASRDDTPSRQLAMLLVRTSVFGAFSRTNPDQLHIGMTAFSCFGSSWRASGQDLGPRSVFKTRSRAVSLNWTTSGQARRNDSKRALQFTRLL